MNIKLRTIIGQPLTSNTPQGPVVTGYRFIAALTTLGDQASLPFKDRYAIGRTLKDINEALAVYEKQKQKLVEKHGKKTSALIEAELSAVNQKILAHPESAGTVADALRKQKHICETGLDQLRKNPAADTYRIDQNDTAGFGAFIAAHEKELDAEVPVYLNHRVLLPEDCTLTASDVMLLIDFVEMTEDRAQAVLTLVPDAEKLPANSRESLDCVGGDGCKVTTAVIKP